MDHRNDSEVCDLFKKIESDHGKLDILVNNAFQVPIRPDEKSDPDLLFRNFWEQPGWFWDSFIDVGLRSHYIASCYAVPVMNKRTSLNGRMPLIVHISSFGGIFIINIYNCTMIKYMYRSILFF